MTMGAPGSADWNSSKSRPCPRPAAISSGAARKAPVTAGSNCPPALARATSTIALHPAGAAVQFHRGRELHDARVHRQVLARGMHRRLAVPAGMPQRHDVRHALRHRQAAGQRARLVAMHLDQRIGLGLAARRSRPRSGRALASGTSFGRWASSWRRMSSTSNGSPMVKAWLTACSTPKPAAASSGAAAVQPRKRSSADQ